MKKTIIATLIAFVSLLTFTTGFAASSSNSLSGLSAAWKTQHSTNISPTQNDILMGYGGQDVSPNRPSLIQHTTVA